jgi:hypothetical protein
MRIYLLTCEEVQESYREAVERLKLLPQRVMLRIPIQWDDEKGRIDDPSDYSDAFKALSAVADIMIECVDSQHMRHFTPSSYKEHVHHCLHVLGRYCKLVEAGNEVNGNWLGSQTAEKVRFALEECQGVKLPAAVTYYLSADEPDQMFEWIDNNPLSSKYALISHYPNTTPDYKIDPKSILSRFARKFSTATTLGWGEYGTEDQNDKNNAPMSERAALIRQVEQHWWELISPLLSNYAGLGGYWDWGTDKELDKVFKEVWS